VDLAAEKRAETEHMVERLESLLNISERWTEDSPDFQKFHQENLLTDYWKSIDELERLVVMRLFELTKLSASGTGMLATFSVVE
jgi:hypothetical protein